MLANLTLLMISSISTLPRVLVFFLVRMGKRQTDDLQVFLEFLYPQNCTKAELLFSV